MSASRINSAYKKRLRIHNLTQHHYYFMAQNICELMMTNGSDKSISWLHSCDTVEYF